MPALQSISDETQHFVVWGRDYEVSEKGWIRLPTDDAIVAAVREAIAAG